MATLRETFGVANVVESMLLDKYYIDDGTKMVLPDHLFGLELEIEHWPGTAGMLGFRYDTDGSLRNSGVEAISNPTKAKFIHALLTNFYKHHRITQAENYSERCSTHVHVNVQDFTLDELKTLGLVYQTTERLLFDFVGNDRVENIFCVPWYQSGVTTNFATNLTKSSKAHVKNWVKYSALNYQPVSTQGTVEFRHLHGTCDVELIVKWINLISCLVRYSLEKSFKGVSNIILNMNTISNYEAYLQDIFKEHASTLMVGKYREKLSIGVVDSKIMLITPPAPKKGSKSAFTVDEYTENWDQPPPPERGTDREMLERVRRNQEALAQLTGAAPPGARPQPARRAGVRIAQLAQQAIPPAPAPTDWAWVNNMVFTGDDRVEVGADDWLVGVPDVPVERNR